MNDYNNLNFLYESGFLSPHPLPKQDVNDGEVFWDCFHQSLQANKKGYNGKKRILSIIAEKFSYKTLMGKLGVSIKNIKNKNQPLIYLYLCLNR